MLIFKYLHVESRLLNICPQKIHEIINGIKFYFCPHVEACMALINKFYQFHHQHLILNAKYCKREYEHDSLV